MNDLDQVLLIKKALEKENEGYLKELARFNDSINKKTDLINKMLMYIGEYANQHNYSVSKGVPSLSVNLYLFSEQIEVVIRKTEVEINQLHTIKDRLMEKIISANKKITLMESFEKKINHKRMVKQERQEQRMLDEVSLSKHIWGDHD